MDFQEYMSGANLYYLDSKGTQRYGQALMNYLMQVSPIAYIAIPAKFDPFYDDKVVNEFLNHLSNNWSELTSPIEF